MLASRHLHRGATGCEKQSTNPPLAVSLSLPIVIQGRFEKSCEANSCVGWQDAEQSALSLTKV